MASRGSFNAGERLKIQKAKSLANKKKRLAALREKLKTATGPNKVRIQNQIRLLNSKVTKGEHKPYTGPKVKHGDSKGHGRKKRYYNQETKKYQVKDPIAEAKKKRLEESRIKTNEKSLKKSKEIGDRKKQNKAEGKKEFGTWDTKKGNQAVGSPKWDEKGNLKEEYKKNKEEKPKENKENNVEKKENKNVQVDKKENKEVNKEDNKEVKSKKDLKSTGVKRYKGAPKGYIKVKGKFASLKSHKGKHAAKKQARLKILQDKIKEEKKKK